MERNTSACTTCISLIRKGKNRYLLTQGRVWDHHISRFSFLLAVPQKDFRIHRTVRLAKSLGPLSGQHPILTWDRSWPSLHGSNKGLWGDRLTWTLPVSSQVGSSWLKGIWATGTQAGPSLLLPHPLLRFQEIVPPPRCCSCSGLLWLLLSCSLTPQLYSPSQACIGPALKLLPVHVWAWLPCCSLPHSLLLLLASIVPCWNFLRSTGEGLLSLESGHRFCYILLH